MSAIDFILEGSSGDSFEEWDYERNVEDEIFSPASDPTFVESRSLVRKNLSERIVYYTDTKFMRALVDNLIWVKTFSQSYREEREAFWKSKRNVTLMGATLIGAGIVLAGVFISSPVVQVALVIGGLATFVFGLYRVKQANDQVKCWQQNLPEIIARQRTEAFTEDLSVIFKKDMKGNSGYPILFSKILTIRELNGLYCEYFESFQRRLNVADPTSNRIALLQEAVSYSPLTKEMMDYVRLFPQYGQLLYVYYQEHQRFIEAFETAQSVMSGAIKDVNREADREIVRIQESKARALEVVYAAYRLAEQYALEKRDEKLALLNGSGPEVDDERFAIIEAYERDLAKAGEIRNLAIQLISLPFDQRIMDIEDTRNHVIQDIQENHQAQMIELFKFIRALHKEAYEVLMGVRLPCQTMDPAPLYPLVETPSFSDPIPSAPPLEEVLRGREEDFDPELFHFFVETAEDQEVSA